MNNTVRGEVHFVDETKTFGEKGFQKRLLVLTQPDGKFQQFIPVEFIREDCAAADTLNVGDEVEVDLPVHPADVDADDERGHLVPAVDGRVKAASEAVGGDLDEVAGA